MGGLNFANVSVLWYLAPLFGVIVLLYLLKMRRKDFKVPATFLWPSTTTDVRANAPLQKLRFSWLMLLQLVAVVLIIGSLARPQTRQEGLAGTVTIFVVDTSASMSARDVRGSRLEEAVSRIESAVSTARTGDRFSLVVAGSTPRVALALSSDAGRMRQALDTLEPTDTKSAVGDALRLAAAIVGSMESGHIVLLSDGAFPEIQNFSQGKASVHFQQIGKSSDNVAITAIGAGEARNERQLFCGVRNYSDSSKKVDLTFYADGKVFDSKPLTVPAGASVGHSASLPAAAGVLRARIEPPDMLMADNSAFALANPSASLRVLLVTKGNIFLKRALSLDPRVTLDQATTLPASERQQTGGASAYDVIVFDDVDEAPVRSRGVLSFGSSRTSIAQVGAAAPAPKVTVADREHELVRHVDLSSTYIDKARQATPAAGARALIESDKGPLVVASDVDKRHVYVAFSLLDSDFALQVGFPIFIANALDFMAIDARPGVLAMQAGRTTSFPAESNAVASLSTPDGRTLRVEADSGNYILRDLNRVGKYTFVAGDKQTVFYANLLDEDESNITPANTLRVNSADVAAARAPARIADFWKPILLLCLAVLTCEWWLFAKKS